MSAEDLTGKRFGRLVALYRVKDYVHPGGDRKAMWLCECSCGGKREIRAHTLKSGFTQSCGCLSVESARRNKTHGLSKTKAYTAWSSMKNRCYNKKCENFKHYGGRGISVCSRWKNSFALFMSDMGNPPSEKHSIGRIDNNKNYEPGNCRWETQKEQTRNQRANVIIEAFGKTQCVAAWAEELGIRPQTIYCRISRGWTGERLLIGPLDARECLRKLSNQDVKEIRSSYRPFICTIPSLAKKFGVSIQTINNVIRHTYSYSNL